MPEIHGEVGAAGVPVHVEDQLPVGASVPRPIDPALRLRRVGVAQGAGIDEVRVLGMDQDARDPPGCFEPAMVERTAAVGGTVDPVPHRERRPDDEGLTGPGPDLAGVRRRDRERADGGRFLIVEDRRPGDPAVARLPDAARGGAEVDDVGVPPFTRGRAQPVPVGPDGPPLETAEKRGIDGGRLRGDSRRNHLQQAQRQPENETNGVSVGHARWTLAVRRPMARRMTSRHRHKRKTSRPPRRIQWMAGHPS